MKLKYMYTFTFKNKQTSGEMFFNTFEDALKAATSMDSFSMNYINRNILNDSGKIICSISNFVISK